MAARTIPGQTAEIPGPKKAFIIPKPEVAAAMIKRAKRVLLIVGSEAVKLKTGDGDFVDTAIRLSSIDQVSIAATGNLIKEFRERNVKGVHSMSLMNLGDRLRSPEWEGLDGGGGYDLVIFAGFPYYMEWLVLSGLKSFATKLKTISLERVYQPNASWSFGNTTKEDWKEIIDKIVSILEEK